MSGVDIREPREGCQRGKLANLVLSTSGRKRRGILFLGFFRGPSETSSTGLCSFVLSSEWAAMRMAW